MVLRSMIYIGIGVGLAIGIAYVSLQFHRSESSEPLSAEAEANPTMIASPTPAKTQADTKVITMNIGGKPIQIELKWFHQPPFPFQAYYSAKDFVPELSVSDRGNSVRFYFSPTGSSDRQTYLHIFVPEQPTNLEMMQETLLGNQGLFVQNNWQLVDRTDIVSYSWANEKLIYRQPIQDGEAIGAVYIGEYEGQSFYAMTHVMPNQRDEFEPRVNIVLESLQFEDDE